MFRRDFLKTTGAALASEARAALKPLGAEAKAAAAVAGKAAQGVRRAADDLPAIDAMFGDAVPGKTLKPEQLAAFKKRMAQQNVDVVSDPAIIQKVMKPAERAGLRPERPFSTEA